MVSMINYKLPSLYKFFGLKLEKIKEKNKLHQWYTKVHHTTFISF